MKENNTINLKELEDTIKSYAQLPLDWDGYQGIAPKQETVAEAIYFLSLLSEQDKLPLVSVAGDGEICFYWKYGQELYLELGFYGDDLYCYIFNSHKPNVLVDDISLSKDGIPADLKEYIRIFN